MESTQVTSLEGPKGKAEIYELVQSFPSGGQRFEYEVHNQGQVQRVLTLGEAYIIAKELTGTTG